MRANRNAYRTIMFASAIAVAAWSQTALGQTVVSAGPVAVDGDASVNNINLGDKIRSYQFAVSKSQMASVNGNVSGTAMSSRELGVQTFCGLSYVYVAGEDNSSTDTGECVVARDTTSGKWTLTALAGGKTDLVKCIAYCMSLPMEAASTQDQMSAPHRVRRQ